MKRLVLLAAITACVGLSTCSNPTPVPKHEAAAVRTGAIVRTVIPGPSLDGDTAGDETPLGALVYLPPSYETQPDRHYPLVVLLHGYWSTPDQWEDDQTSLLALSDEALARGDARELIIVMPSGEDRLGGGFYVNGSASGNWEDYVAEDVVAFMDAGYRTLSTRESRGIAGHSMGGYGALSVAAARPDVFSAVYAMSPCCGDLIEDFGLDAPSWADADKLDSDAAFQASEDFYARVLTALGAAWAPDASAPLNSRRPVAGGEVDEAIYEIWKAHTLRRRVADEADNLRTYSAIGLDVGDQEDFPHILKFVPQLVAQMEELGLEVEYEMYPGDHVSGVGKQLSEEVLPFFSEHLDAG